MGLDFDKVFVEPLFHAYLLEGQSDILEKACEELVLRILCSSRPPCRKCDSCVKFLSGNHLDVKTIDGASPIKEVREFLSDLWMSPSEGDKKIYIFKNADLLSEYSQNTLLLPIEEPPKGVYFIMLCRFCEKILPTVKSRCRTVSLGGEEPENEEYETYCRDFCSSLFGKDAVSVFSLLDFKKDGRDKFSEFIRYFCGYCRGRVKIALEKKDDISVSAYLSLLDTGLKWSEKSELNLNMSLAVTGFVSDCFFAVRGD